MRRRNPEEGGAASLCGIGRYLKLGVLAVPLAGCTDVLDRLLQVEAPSQVEARDLEHPRNARLLVDGLVAEFECAFGHYIAAGGLIGSELTDAQQTAAQWDYDRRTITPASGWYATSTCNDRLGMYTPLSTARWTADNTLAQLEGWSDTEVSGRTALIATAAAYSGYSHVLMGEGFCSAAFDAGPEQTRPQIFERAEERFTRAIAAAEAANRADLRNMAYVGRARARLNLGKGAEAAADARMVPRGFVRNANYSAAAARAENRIFVMNNRSRFVSVYDAFRQAQVGGVADTRVPLVNTGARGANQQTVIWNQMKYPSAASPIPIARWAEAQLIIAEVEGGQAAVEIINTLRAVYGLPRFESSDPAAIRAQVIQERRRELFLESHHLGDLIRYDLPLDPAPGAPFVNGGLYGNMRCMPLPDVERLNNPNIG
jgi:starch-binding outer membrane protein, SusD/RagB family